MSKLNINIQKDYDVKSYKDVSPYDRSKHVCVALFSFTATYVNRLKDYVGEIKNAEIGFGLQDGGVFIHDVITVPPEVTE